MSWSQIRNACQPVTRLKRGAVEIKSHVPIHFLNEWPAAARYVFVLSFCRTFKCNFIDFTSPGTCSGHNFCYFLKPTQMKAQNDFNSYCLGDNNEKYIPIFYGIFPVVYKLSNIKRFAKTLETMWLTEGSVKRSAINYVKKKVLKNGTSGWWWTSWWNLSRNKHRVLYGFVSFWRFCVMCASVWLYTVLYWF